MQDYYLVHYILADAILENIASVPDMHWVDIKDHLKKESDNQIDGVLNMMKTDGLIIRDIYNKFKIKAEPKGITFKINGGYEQKLITDSLNLIAAETANSNAVRNEKWLRYGAVGAAIGSCCLVIIEIIKLCLKCN